MKYLFILILVFTLSQEVLANAKTQLEKVNNFTQQKFKKNFVKKNTKNTSSTQNTNKHLTNYEYDEQNYHYNKYQKYVKENLKYSQSGKMKY